MASTFNGAPLTTVALADGKSYFYPNFLAEAGIDAGDLWAKFGSGQAIPELWLDPSEPAMKYRGRELQRIKFFVSLSCDGGIPRYSYTGFQYDSMSLYKNFDSPEVSFVVELADKLRRGLIVDSHPVDFNQAIGTLYQDRDHNIGAHSDRPRDIQPVSFIFDISLGGDRDFVLAERTADEQEKWIRNSNNILATGEAYANNLGRVVDRVTMRHGSAIVLSTATNSRWTHEVPKPLPMYPAAPRVSLVLRQIATKISNDELCARVEASKRAKAAAAKAKEARRGALADFIGVKRYAM
jgi:alkylated DNA repair dioxygenase AlkB